MTRELVYVYAELKYLRKRSDFSILVTVDQKKGPTQLDVSAQWSGRCMVSIIILYVFLGIDRFVGSNVLARSAFFCKLGDISVDALIRMVITLHQSHCT